MHRSHTALTVLATLLLIVTSLTGCIREERDITLNGDGSGTYVLTLGFLKGLVTAKNSTVAPTMEAFGQKISGLGGRVREYEDDKFTYWEFTRPVRDVNELNVALGDVPQGSGQNSPSSSKEVLKVTEEDSFLSTTFHVSGTLDFGAENPPDANAAAAFADAKETLSVTMPGWVTSHQGGTQKGNTVTWELRYGETQQVDLVGGGNNSTRLAFISGAALVALLAAVGLGAFLAGRGRRERNAPPIPVS